MDVLEHVADQEENRNRVHNRMDLFGFAADQFDDCIADATKGNAFGNAVGKRHHGNGEEARNGDLHVVPVDITDAAHHHNANQYQHGVCRSARNKSEERREEYRQNKTDSRRDAGQTGTAAFRNTGTGFYIGGDCRSAQDSANRSCNSVCHQSLVGARQLAVLCQESSFARSTIQCTNGVEHVDHGQRNQNGNQGENGNADSLVQLEQLTKAAEELAKGWG